MTSSIIRPRFIDHYEVLKSQAELDFAVPFLDEDIPLYLDPFLLWKSPSQQDQSMHTTIIDAFNALGRMSINGNKQEAIKRLCALSECDEAGLGTSGARTGKRIGLNKAEEVLSLFERVPRFSKFECNHIEETQLVIDGISKDRISDISANLIKSFIIDFTVDQCTNLGVPLKKVALDNIWSVRDRKFIDGQSYPLPINPISDKPILLIPKRWLRFTPWINFEDYFTKSCPQDDIAHTGEKLDRVKVLQYNIDNYGVIDDYVRNKEKTFEDCKNDPLFLQIPIISAKRKLKAIAALSTGNKNGEDKEYEQHIEALLPSLLYPHLDFATAQSRTESGVSIRDLVFYNNRNHAFLDELVSEYNCRQMIFELKNVRSVEREHIDQISRYLAPGIGHFGIIVTRNELSNARLKQTIDLWSGHRKCVITLTDQDIAMMVSVFESKQRLPLEVINKKYFEFRQKCPV